MADLLDPPVTSLDRHDAELGRRSAELLLGALRTGSRAAPGGAPGGHGAAPAPLLRLRRAAS